MDKYTRAVLTVIAVCLVIQTSDQIIEKAYANDTVQKVIICDGVNGIQKPSDCAVVSSGKLWTNR